MITTTAQTPVGSMETVNPSTVSHGILYYTHYNYPLTFFVFFIVLFLRHSINASPNRPQLSKKSNLTGPDGKPLPASRPSSNAPPPPRTPGFGKTRSLLFVYLSVALIATFVANSANVILHALAESEKHWWAGPAAVVYYVGSTFLYSLYLITLVDSKPSPTSVHLIIWSVSLVVEITLLVASIIFYTNPHGIRDALNGSHVRQNTINDWEIAEILCDATRVLLLALCVSFYLFFTWQMRVGGKLRTSRERAAARAEREPLLGGMVVSGDVHVENGMAHQTGNSTPTYGATPANGHSNGKPKAPGTPNEGAAFYRPTGVPQRGWWEYLQSYTLFFPYLWPSKDTKLQLTVLLCFSLSMIQRVVNFMVPCQMGRVVDILQHPERTSSDQEESGGIVHAITNPATMPWFAISFYIALRFCQGGNGVFGAMRSVLWIPVSQFAYKALSTSSFEHVHSLSLEFHLGKRTGEVLSALNKGASINNFLEQVTFQVIPMLIDLGIAVFYFAIGFDIYYALTVTVVTFWYLYATIRIASMRQAIRRKMIDADREEEAVKNDSITSYETVKYFGAEEYEFNKFRTAVQTYQGHEYSVQLSLAILNIVQNGIFLLGLLVVAFIAAYQVTINQRSAGDFVVVMTYMTQLQGPLNYFGTFYRSIQSAMISGERLLELFKEQPTVVDKPGVRDLDKCEGRITFENLHFFYDERKPALNGLSFDCKPGTTTALVGESGGGKSTVFRLLFRFYNEQEGRILLDGHDVRDISIKSLRSHIGVVPQDTVLFNDTIMYNLKYANQAATDEDVYEACRAASIHDKILRFPDGYNTKVGERGLRLSGGEKQRVAIARTILKNPRIIMLDEATAALDSETEQHIQDALKKLSRGRTMLVIAHRLSTITDAEQIVVLHEGVVAEKGTHDELLAQKGRYYSMWQKQIRAENAAEEARILSEEAKKLLEMSLATDFDNSS